MGCCNAIATDHGRYGQQKLWSVQAVLSLNVWHVRVYVVS